VQDDDSVLRRMFEREARLVPHTRDAHAALVAIEPALRRAAIKRVCLISASAVLLLGGGATAFQAVRVPDAAVSVGARPIPVETVPAITTAPPAAPPSSSRADVDEGAAPTTPRRAESPVVTTEVDTTGRTTVAPAATSPDPAAPTTIGDMSPAPPPTNTEPSQTTLTPTTSATTVPPPAAVTYDTECGVVVADLSTAPPTLLDVTPREGFEVHVEDPDHGRITVHFAGHDHECEIHVGAPAPEEPHTSHDEPSDD
jgi:hypothetical protein